MQLQLSLIKDDDALMIALEINRRLMEIDGVNLRERSSQIPGNAADSTRTVL
jgi:hypothetical protein